MAGREETLRALRTPVRHGRETSENRLAALLAGHPEQFRFTIGA
jgi:hypothetical protein